MSKTLVAYFSASGVTEKAAHNLASAIGADIFEIEPSKPYSSADLNWNNRASRSSVEMNDPSSRPGVKNSVSNPQDYDTVFIGFPVWWDQAPRVVNTFLESNGFSGKEIVLFCTSGGTGIEGSVRALKRTYGNRYVWKGSRRLSGRENANQLNAWVKSL